jgi:hypothetical protein
VSADLDGWPDNSLDFWPKAAAAFLASIDPGPGPPYTHAITAPEPYRNRHGRVVYRPPPRWFSLGPFVPVGRRTVIRADFCQCATCRALRLELVPPEGSDEG